MTMRRFCLIPTSTLLGLLAAALFLLAASADPGLTPGLTTRVSVASDGAQANDESRFPAISADGRFVAFHSRASNLVSGDTNKVRDIFVHDRQTGATTRVSVDSAGTQANNTSLAPAISGDGRFVAFESIATNLVSGDTNKVRDVFVHDRQTGATTRVSVDSSGTQANNASLAPAISSDGRFVAFESSATNLVAGDSNGTSDVFVRDRQTGATTRVSVDSSGTQANNASLAPAISGDGRFVAFESNATNLVAGDTNGTRDLFVHDRQTAATIRVSVSSAGAQGNGASRDPAISGDGRFVAFHSDADNLIAGDSNGFRDVFVRDRVLGITARVSLDSAGAQANGDSCHVKTLCVSISSDGRFVAFHSRSARNLVAGDSNGAFDVFVHDRQTGVTTRVSVASAGGQGNDGSFYPALSGDGRFVAFHSRATNLVAGDTNGTGTFDVFVHDRLGVLLEGPLGDPTCSDGVDNDGDGLMDGADLDCSPPCSGYAVTIVGTPGDDIITGTGYPDVIHGLGGNDTIDSLARNDVVCGGDGNDTLNGGDSPNPPGDILLGGGGSDTLNGGNGKDNLSGGDGNDILNGDAGNDSLDGGAGDDAMDGGIETDACDGGPHIVGDTAVNCEKVSNVP